jgi:hypothetical protein
LYPPQWQEYQTHHRFDDIVKSVILDAYLALRADVAALAVEHFASTKPSTRMLSGVPLIQRLPLGSSLDRQQVITSISGKIQKARTAKRLADLALLAGSPIDA